MARTNRRVFFCGWRDSGGSLHQLVRAESLSTVAEEAGASAQVKNGDN